MFYVNYELPFITIKQILHSYGFGEVDRIQCISQMDGLRRIIVHYKKLMSNFLRYFLEVASVIPYCPCVLYGPNYVWYLYKTSTVTQRTHIPFKPIQRIS
jgi:hypothetical protein